MINKNKRYHLIAKANNCFTQPEFNQVDTMGSDLQWSMQWETQPVKSLSFSNERFMDLKLKRLKASWNFLTRKYSLKHVNGYATLEEWQESVETERWALAQALGLASTPKQAVLEMHGMA